MPEESVKRICFVICPIGPEKSDVRERTDKIYKHIITPTIKQCGYHPERADKISKSGNIGKQIIEHLLEDDLVIADLTGHNPNVLYELAIRHMTGKPFIHMIKSDEKIPFDLIQNRAIKLDHTDLDSIENCKKELENQIRNLEVDPTDLDNPITIAVDLITMRESENPIDKKLGETISLLQTLDTSIKGNILTSSEYFMESHDDIQTQLTLIIQLLTSIATAQIFSQQTPSPPDNVVHDPAGMVSPVSTGLIPD